VADLFELSELAASLQMDLDTASAIEARRKAQGWLAAATRITEWPSPPPEDLRAWAMELAALAYDNPSGLESEVDGRVTSVWGRRRRGEILLEAKRTYGHTGPMGSFPQPEPWPDPRTPGPVSWRIYET
jgi:hypothetical protein